MGCQLTGVINHISPGTTARWRYPPRTTLLFCVLLKSIEYLNLQVKTWLSLIEIPT